MRNKKEQEGICDNQFITSKVFTCTCCISSLNMTQSNYNQMFCPCTAAKVHWYIDTHLYATKFFSSPTLQNRRPFSFQETQKWIIIIIAPLTWPNKLHPDSIFCCPLWQKGRRQPRWAKVGTGIIFQEAWGIKRRTLDQRSENANWIWSKWENLFYCILCPFKTEHSNLIKWSNFYFTCSLYSQYIHYIFPCYFLKLCICTGLCKSIRHPIFCTHYVVDMIVIRIYCYFVNCALLSRYNNTFDNTIFQNKNISIWKIFVCQ